MHILLTAILRQIFDFISTFLTPVMLLGCGLILSFGIRLRQIIAPRRFLHTLLDVPKDGHTTPFKAVTMALAGTLGVGNITGVSAAILQGGVGAVFWMWIGALFSMAVKYGEVALAVLYRKKDDAGRWYGGMMYVIRDGLGKRIPKGTASVLGGGFACLCLSNALVTGNIVQSNAAANVLEPVPAWISGAVLALLTTAALVYGIGKAGDITMRLIPGMTLLYMVLSLWIILGNLELLPSICRQICTEAFSFHALAGGFTGLGIRSVLRGIGQSGFGQSMRFGIARGIFSNEAGCGTSPSAHASADTKSPFHQGCYGILEVICDTLVLCTMTAFVLCIGDRQYGIFRLGGDNLSLRAYQMFGGDIVYGMMAVMVALFAYATILAQMYYASTALRYFTDRRWVHHLYTAAAVSCVIIGAVMETDTIWALADGVICTMTCINTAVLFCMRREIYETVPEKKKDKF